MRAFVKMPEVPATHKSMAARMRKLEEAAPKRHTSLIAVVVEDIMASRRSTVFKTTEDK